MVEKFLFTAHGFGVGRTSNGLFPEVAKELPDHTLKMMSFYKPHQGGHPKDIDIMTHSEQAELLRVHMDKVEGEKILMAHSMGNVALGMAILSRQVQVAGAIMLAPALDANEDNIMDNISRVGGTIHRGGMSSFASSSDGVSVFLPANYFDVEELDLFDMYQQVADTVPTVVVRALHDQFVDPDIIGGIRNAHHISVDSGHNFTSEARLRLRQKLAEAVKQGALARGRQ